MTIPRRPDQGYLPPAAAATPGALKPFRKIIIIPGSNGGLFVYSPSPGFGNLIQSTGIPAATTDPYGNAVLAGETTYTSSGGNFQAINITGQTLTLTSATSAAGPYSTIDATIALDATFTNLVITAAQGIILDAINAPIKTQPSVQFLTQAAQSPAAGGPLMYADNGNRLHVVNVAGSDLAVEGCGLASNSTVTATAATFTSLASAVIIANDARAQDVYRLTVFGYGTWGSTRQSLTIQARFGATAATVIGGASVIDSTALAISAAFQFQFEMILSCVTSGVSATWRAMVTGCVAETASNLDPGTPASNSIPIAEGTGATDVTLDSTANETMGISVLWASTTGAPTITKTLAFFEKLTQ